ncbi:MAG: GGDEF and EAL domain-containing protein [Proteobacteria bacterium]|nr:GGDEF and EAL domain-containing protein [Pseudomonadota bacterium]
MDSLPLSSATDFLSASGHVGYQWDLLTDRIVWFGPWQNLFGHDQAEPPSNALELSTIVLPSDHHLIFNDTQPIFDREFRLRSSYNLPVWVHEHGTTDFKDGRAIRQQAIIRVVEKATDENKPRSFSSDRDELTGRPNRSCMLDLIQKILHHPRENRRNTAYMVVGIDMLVLLNEAVGTKMANHLICAVADRLNEICPTRAIVSRVGGDMFGILLPGMAKDMESLATRILASFHDRAISTKETHLHLSVCVGCVPFSEDAGDAADLMIHAEQALHEAQQLGNGHKIIYCESERRAEHHRQILDICERVKQSLKNDTVHVAFQPVINAGNGDVVFYEALSRLAYDDGKLIAAGDFIPVVEQMGLAPEFDSHILDIAINELKSDDKLVLAVNISGLTASHPKWPEHIHNRLVDQPDVAARLIIEITETAAVLDIAKMKTLVCALREVGSSVALDDFGAGSTSIRHLRDLDFAIMKIDRDLVIDVTTNKEQQHLVRMLVAMAKGLGLRTVAEGIEDQETGLWLRDEGVDYLQGFFYGRPSFSTPWHEKVKGPEVKNAEQTPLYTGSPASQQLSENDAPTLCF